jgi:transposase
MVFYSRRLDEVLPDEHCARLLDELLGQLDWSAWEASYHGRIGQPAIHPQVLASVLLYGLLTRIRSSRGLEDALQVRLDFRWLAHGHTIDHTTLSEFRRKHSAELRDLFVQVVQLAQGLDLVHFQRLGFDGTRVRANNRRSGTRTPEQLREECKELEQKFDDLQQQAEAEDAQDEELFGTERLSDLPPELRNPQRRREKIQATLQELERGQAAGLKMPKRVPTTDLDARVMPNKDGGHAPNYTPLATVDINSGLIVADDVLNMVNEDSQLIPAIEQVQQQFGLTLPPEVLTDGLNGTGANLAACAERGLSLVSPCELVDPANPALRADPTKAVAEVDWPKLPTHAMKVDGQAHQQLDKAAFVFDPERNCYWCPNGQALEYQKTTSEKCGSGRRIRDRYQAAATACAECPLKALCVPGKQRARMINREQYEEHRQRHATKMATPEAQATYKLRRHAGERPFAVIKHQFGLRRFLLRGLDRVRDEWRWATTAFNLQRLMSLVRSRAGPLQPSTAPNPSP